MRLGLQGGRGGNPEQRSPTLPNEEFTIVFPWGEVVAGYVRALAGHAGMAHDREDHAAGLLRATDIRVDGYETMNSAVRGGHAIALRMLDLQADLPLLRRWLQSPHVSRWWGPQDLQVAMLAQRSRATDAIITADDEPVGYLCWQTPSPSERESAGLTALPANLVDIDILIGEPEFLGRGVGPSALVLLLAKLRRDGAGVAGLGTSTSNHAALRAFEKAGFRPFRDFEDPVYGPCRYLVAPLAGELGEGA